MANPKNPEQIGRYQIVNRLGEGGMGVLYLATDPLLQRTVAIKVLSVYNDELRERFAREARSAASLRHNHIVTIYDVGDDGGLPFLAMEYLDGETMAELIRRRASLPIVRKLQLLLELCDGLGYAHRTGIIHRDIKPANLMVTSEGVLKILDFGLARLTNDATGAGLTRVGVLIGTPHYMSPEQIQGWAVDHRSDIFAVGLVAYEFLTYKKAYPGDAPHAVLDKILHSEPQPLLQLKPDLQPQLVAAVTKAIEKNPDRRYDRLSAFAADLTLVREQLLNQDATVRVTRRGPTSSGETPPPSGERSPVPVNFPNFEAIARRRAAEISRYLVSAQEFFTTGQYLSAIEQCEQAALLDPDDVRVIDLLQRAHRAIEDKQIAQWLEEAQALLKQGSLSTAERLVDESLALRPKSPEAQSLQQQIKTRRREQERAAERERVAQSAIARARASLQEGAFEAAIRCATEALAYDPGRADAKAIMAHARTALEERRLREEHDRQAHEIVARARALAADEQLEEAVRSLRAFDPPHEVVSEALADLESRLAALEQRRREEQERLRREQERAAARERAVQSALARARANLEKGALEAAIRSATEALAHDPGLVEAQKILAHAQTALEERRLREEQERRANETVARARALATGDQLDEAVQSLRTFEPPHAVVAAALRDLEAEVAARARRRRDEEEKRRRQIEDAGRREREEEERRRQEEARRREEERIAREREEVLRQQAEAEERRRAAELQARQEQAAALKDAARTALRKGAFAAAITALERAREAIPDDVEIGPLVAVVIKTREQAEIAERRQRAADRHVSDAAACLDRNEPAAALRLVGSALELLPSHPAALQLRERLRSLLEEQRRAEVERRAAVAAANSARRLFVAGDYPGAVRLLEAFSPRALVAPVLDELHTEWRRQEQKRQEAEELRRALEEEAARALDEQRRAKAEADRLEAARAAAAAESAAQAERARQRAEAERAAQEAVAARAKAEAEAAYAARHVEAAPDEEETAEYQLENTHEISPVVDNETAESDVAVHVSRPAEPDQVFVEAGSTVEPGAIESVETMRRDQSGSHIRLAAIATLAVGAIVLAAWGAWRMTHAPSTSPPISGGSAPIPSPPSNAPPGPGPAPPAVEGTSDLKNATAKYDGGDLAGAAALALSASQISVQSKAALDLISRIRTAAADAAQLARTNADRSGAEQVPAYQVGVGKERAAEELTGPSDIVRVVGLYGEARTGYEEAASAARESAALVGSATDAFKRGNAVQALTAAEQALARNPTNEVIRLFQLIRQRAQREATDARGEAIRQGAERDPSFVEAEGRRAAAERNRDPKQTRQQVTALNAVRDLYLTAARESTARRTRAAQSITAGRDALRRGELQAAEKNLVDAIAAEPSVAGAASLKTDIEAARRRAEAKPPAPPNVTSPPTTPSTPVRPPGNVSVPPPATPAPAVRAADRAAIADTLKSYATAHEHLDAKEVVKVAPYLAGSAERNLQNAFKDLRSFGMQIDPREPTFSEDGMSASVRCAIVREIVTRNTGREPRRTETADVTLSKRDGKWVITKVQTVSGGR